MNGLRQATEGHDVNRSSGDEDESPEVAGRGLPASPYRRRREVVVSVLVIGSLLVAVVASIVVGAERPYPGVALGSGLLLQLERAVAVWTIVLLALVVGDQALRGRLPDEISGRGVRYVVEERVDEVAGANGDLGDRVEVLGAAVEAIEGRAGRS